MKSEQIGNFCIIYGYTVRNRILEWILEFDNLDFAISDIISDLEISKPKFYEYIKEFETIGIITKSRIIGKTQLYKLDKGNPIALHLHKSFMDCLSLKMNIVATI